MIAPTPFFSDRGCHTRIYEEIKALQNRGDEILLCTYGLGRDMQGVKTVRCYNPPWYRKQEAGPSKTKILLLPFLAYSALKALVRFRPDVVHCHLHEGACIGRALKFFFPAPRYVFDAQGSLSGELLQHGFIAHPLIVRLFREIESWIANWFPTVTSSERVRQEILDMGVDPKRCINVGDGVDTGVFAPRSPDRSLMRSMDLDDGHARLVFMGLLEEYQGVDVMLEAMQLVVKQEQRVQLIIIGFPNVEKYRERCRLLGIADHCVFAGRIAYDKTPAYLSLAQVAIAPKIAKTESDGKVYNYMAMGLPIVAFDRPVAREILGDACVFAEFGSAQSLAEGILRLLRDREYAEGLGLKARQRAVDTLSWDRVAMMIQGVYHQQDGMPAAKSV